MLDPAYKGGVFERSKDMLLVEVEKVAENCMEYCINLQISLINAFSELLDLRPSPVHAFNQHSAGAALNPAVAVEKAFGIKQRPSGFGTSCSCGNIENDGCVTVSNASCQKCCSRENGKSANK
ncbi:hypothetical protein GPALN_007821 [Globodera pallida]|nr:hypothetical protein GPALN_007821 [Globodera pallida]